MSDNYDAVVKQFTQRSLSIPTFKDVLTEGEIEAIAKYINEVIAPMGK